jgi:hypothetical protein
MKIARVFPTKTTMSPTDPDAYFSTPELFTPEYDEIHISVNFTWDIKKAEWLKKQWEKIAPVKIGGVAIDGEFPEPQREWKSLQSLWIRPPLYKNIMKNKESIIEFNQKNPAEYKKEKRNKKSRKCNVGLCYIE